MVFISVDGDKPLLNVEITAFRGDEWLGTVDVNTIDTKQLQEVVDMLTKRGPRAMR